MADTKSLDIKLLKHTQISVHVEEALPDLLVVSYELGVKIYKGVLLESTKRNLPCGIPSLHPAFTKTDAEDPLYAVNQRFAYIEPKAASNALSKKNAYIPAKHKPSKMTVRLRPRQVLCSKCKGICNENNENVGRKRKSSIDADSGSHTVSAKRSVNAPVTRSTVTIATSAENRVRFELRSRQTLLSPPQNRDSSSSTGSVVTRASNGEDRTKVLSGVKETDSNVALTVAEAVVVPKKSDLRSARRTLRRKPTDDPQVSNENNNEGKNNNIRSQSNANSSSVVNEISSSNSNSSSSTCSSTRTIKICYGPQGEGTVLKIPAQIDHLHGNSTDEKEIDVLNEVPIEVDPIGHMSDRATRKALKKAKKEARKRPSTPPLTNIIAASNTATTSVGVKPSVTTFPPPVLPHHTSQHYQLPHATAGAVSPARYTLGADVTGNASPKHGSGCANTPRAVIEGASAGDKLDLAEPSGANGGARKRKHKVKHKKRHREDKERKSVDNDDDTSQCSTQKLSISLKRLNDTYCATTIPFLPIDESSASSDELIPDFPANETQEPKPNSPLTSITKDADGLILCAGDVVWGKMQGFPWWPAKVLTITDSSLTEVNDDVATVHVSWYGSDTSSVLPPHQLRNYLHNYKIRYNKKKRGPYREATRLATIEARMNAEHQPIVTPFLPTGDSGNTSDTTPAPMYSYQSSYALGSDTSDDITTAQLQPVAVSPTHSNTASSSPTLTAVRPALASPREINVIS